MGVPKASLEWHGSTLLRRVAGVVERAVDGPLVIVRSAGQELPRLPSRYEVVDDVHEGQGPLEGLAVGLRALGDRCELAYASSTDVPFLHTSFIGAVVGGIGDRDEICVPVIGRRWHPLAAAYRTGVLPIVDALLAADERRVSGLFDRCRVTELDRAALLCDAALASGDPRLESVVNVNDAEAYVAARARPAPEIAVGLRLESDRPPAWASDRAAAKGGCFRAATLGGLADAVGVSLTDAVAVRLNGALTRQDRELPLEWRDVVVFEAADPGGVEVVSDLPVIRVPKGAPPITAEMVRRALDED
jgi:molybdopterin-guanine dinucleotide biosynthesis protein A